MVRNNANFWWGKINGGHEFNKWRQNARMFLYRHIESIVNGVKIRNVQHSEIDRANGFLISHDHYTIAKDASELEIHTNSFSLQIYTAEELQAMLSKNGFEIIHLYDMEGNDFIADKSLNILTVARKKKV